MHYLSVLKYFLIALSVFLISCGSTQPQVTARGSSGYKPAPYISYKSLNFRGVSGKRKDLIKEALLVRKESNWPKYIFGSADPSKGGFDCSGAMYYVLRRKGFNPPRTSSAQYSWVKEKGNLHSVSSNATSLKHRDFRKLKPGDLVFWSGTYKPTDGRTVPVTHVGMYLGFMEGYERPIMICASKGRSFNGIRCDGYGVFDFKIPSASSKAKIVGYGSPL